jgi:hypothetical protein
MAEKSASAGSARTRRIKATNDQMIDHKPLRTARTKLKPVSALGYTLPSLKSTIHAWLELMTA